MKIAQIAPLWENIPPPLYGGTERIVYYLTEKLTKKAHEVTLFACGTSKSSAHLVSVYPRPLFRDHIPWTNLMYPLLNITEALDREKKFDLIHMHLNKSSDYLSLPLFAPLSHKVVFTLHFPYPVSQQREDRHKVLQKYRHLNYISISNSQRKGGENLNWVNTVYNGVDEHTFQFNQHPTKDYLLWVGKFNPDKGTKEAIMAAKQSGRRILIAGAVDSLEGADKVYFEKEIKPELNETDVICVGEVNDEKKNELYGNAYCFLNPIKWNEPFGLVMAEALSTGCPVISFKNGAAPEIIREGETGYLVDTVDKIVEAIKKIDAIDRKKCRERIESHFTISHMADSYEKVYTHILKQSSSN